MGERALLQLWSLQSQSLKLGNSISDFQEFAVDDGSSRAGFIAFGYSILLDT